MRTQRFKLSKVAATLLLIVASACASAEHRAWEDSLEAIISADPDGTIVFGRILSNEEWQRMGLDVPRYFGFAFEVQHVIQGSPSKRIWVACTDCWLPLTGRGLMELRFGETALLYLAEREQRGPEEPRYANNDIAPIYMKHLPKRLRSQRATRQAGS